MTVIGLAACSAIEVKKETVEQTEAARTGPELPPFRSITGFSGALRCMDNLMIDYGVRDISMLVEEIGDQTKKVNAGTRDMLITAVSDMTRRSRAVRVVAFGKDATNVISFLSTAQRQSAYEVIPQYDIKGSVSQFDENVIRNQKDFGFGISPFINLGVARDAASSVLGLDLSVLTTSDMSILAGVTSRNSVAILKAGKGLDADAAYHKFGLNYSMTLSKSEGQSQALRGLVELAVVELTGKLTKTPYWTCLGADSQANDEIQREISDWYFAMATSRVELIGYFQVQLRRRGFYEGPIDGEFNPAIDEAIGNYRAALGLSKESLLDEAFFKAYLAADHSKIPRPASPSVFVAPPPAAPATASTTAPAAPAAAAAAAAPTGSAASGPLTLSLSTANRQTRFARGELVNLLVQPTRDAHVYCYLQDETSKITRFYPNRFAKDSLVLASKPLNLPGQMRFQLSMNPKGVTETIACFATQRDVLADLPRGVVGVDFEPLAVTGFEQIRNAFVATAGGAVAQERFNVQAK
jgi:peptidoglycan hydrolase-like protein with peptidoglycan-binding domain